MIRMTVTVFDESVRRAFTGMSAQARDLRPAMDEVGAMLMTSIDMRFEQERDPDGKSWEPLAPSTVKAKAKAGHEAMLQWSGRLRGSITRQADSTSVEVGTNIPYAAAQNNGAAITKHAQSRQVFRRFAETKGKGGKVHRELQPGFVKKDQANFASWHAVPEHAVTIPARPFMGISQADRDAGVEILRNFVLNVPGVNP